MALLANNVHTPNTMHLPMHHCIAPVIYNQATCLSLLLAERAIKSKITETGGAQGKIMTSPKRPHMDLSNAFVILHESFTDIPNRPRPQRVRLNLSAADVTFSMLPCPNEKR